MKNKKVLLLMGIFCAVFLFLGAVGPALAASDFGLKDTADVAYGQGISYATDLPVLIGNIIGAGLSMISVVFFGLMLWGGIRWMTSRGDEGEAGKARDTIVAAIIGIIIVMAAYALTNFVFSSIGLGSGETTTCSSQGTGYACRDRASCQVATIKTGLCPGGVDNVCCVLAVDDDGGDEDGEDGDDSQVEE